MSKEKDLIKNTFIIFIGKISLQFVSFTLLPLYTAFLATEEYGIIDLVATYVSLLAPIIVLQLDMAVFRFLIDARKNESETNKIIANTIIAMIAFIVVFVIGYFILFNFIDLKYEKLILLNILTYMIVNIFMQIARGKGENKTYSISSCITALFSILLNLLFIIAFKMGAKGALLATAISYCMSTIYLYLRLKIYKSIHIKVFDKNLLKDLFKYSIPLIPNSISWWIVNVSDRTIISFFLGVAANGIYAVSNKFSSICIALFSIFSLSWTESVSVHINTEDRDEFFSKTINKVLTLFMCIAICLNAIMPFAFDIVIGKAYAEAYNYMPILIFAAVFHVLVSLYSAIYIAKKMTKQVAMTSVVSGIINIVINLAFIKFCGLYAAAFSTLIAYMTMAIYRHYDLKKYVNVKLNKKNIICFVLIGCINSILYYFNNLWGNIINIVIVSSYTLYANWDIIKAIIKKIKEKVKKP